MLNFLIYLFEEAGLYVFHAGTKADGEDYVANGGRVILVAASESTLKEAQQKVYDGLSKLQWDGLFFRKDIGWRTFQ